MEDQDFIFRQTVILTIEQPATLFGEMLQMLE
jgi:hypothetical protein